MHSVNNGPIYDQRPDLHIVNLEDYRAAGIPYARTHDASLCYAYGGEHTVDTAAIFPDFEKDPYDPASYDFCLTDEYLQTIRLAGTQPFYRLGSKIEHWPKKYTTLPPADFHKWAVICEHIIKHYNEGWADGFHMGIEYWEIWNEPDLDPDDSDNKRCWGGTAKEYYALYVITATHLKQVFPSLKIGGPACAGIHVDWLKGFFERIGTAVPFDFFSWHCYTSNPRVIAQNSVLVRQLLDENGYTETESILNEWNYVAGWEEKFRLSIETILGLKGAAFTSAVLCEGQRAPLDMLMYYDASPCAFNGLFEAYTLRKLKGYYPFLMFRTLYELQTCVEACADMDSLYLCAAGSENAGAVMLTYFDDDGAAPPELTFLLHLKGIPDGTVCEYYLLDEEHDMALVKKEPYYAPATVTIGLYHSILVKIGQ